MDDILFFYDHLSFMQRIQDYNIKALKG